METLKYQFENEKQAKRAVKKLVLANCKCAILGSSVVALATMHNRGTLARVCSECEGYCSNDVSEYDREALIGSL